jgi:hypothetical protein
LEPEVIIDSFAAIPGAIEAILSKNNK